MVKTARGDIVSGGREPGNPYAAVPPSPPPRPPRFIRLRELLQLVGYSKTQLYDMIARGEFPRQVPLGPRAVGWDLDEVLAWRQQRLAARDAKGLPRRNS